MTTEATKQWQPLTMTPETQDRAPDAEGLRQLISDEQTVADLILNHKAIVFRGFSVDPRQFDEMLTLLLPHRLAYTHGNSPRTKVGDNVYTSTEYPAELTISMHNELSYSSRWPSRLTFYCERRPATGGATPVVDGSQWLQSLDDDLKSAFAGGLRYTQNLHDGYGLGKSWQETFETSDRDAVEQYLAEVGATWEWKSDGGIRIHQTRPATIAHPQSGVEVWFNQVDQWHLAGLDPDTAQLLSESMPADDLPQNVTFADGSDIPPEYVLQVRDRGLDGAVDVNWEAGDLMVIDNVALAHGRRPFTGSRRVLVAMSG